MQEIAVYDSRIEKQTNKRTEPKSKAKIFIVEDEMLVLEDLKQLLIQENYEIVGVATSGTEAIENIKSSVPDLVIMDVRIKGELDGIEVAIVIQSHFDYPVPVIFLTGLSEKEFPHLKVLPDYIYINKPFQERILFHLLERALTKSRQERGLQSDKRL